MQELEVQMEEAKRRALAAATSAAYEVLAASFSWQVSNMLEGAGLCCPIVLRLPYIPPSFNPEPELINQKELDELVKEAALARCEVEFKALRYETARRDSRDLLLFW